MLFKNAKTMLEPLSTKERAELISTYAQIAFYKPDRHLPNVSKLMDAFDELEEEEKEEGKKTTQTK